ncbi:hypothetical protein SAMN05421788_106132 [Filimonas lacunae]|uniref:Uncharacterized protein n=1 Tax=Filimonas lacunae TaxID=477680 RepID=A0A173MEP9_9BACT|nr:hypothetical protein [Filimonas lacunae]BAV06064.1 hypothetical protein FLA_2079 [Filimonas lacunae]SIT24489.1 hypothetical protein SAMN05421788_106132 [Filimonas lacunae]
MKNPNSKKKGNTYFEGTGKDKSKEISAQRRTYNKGGYSEDVKDVVPEKTEVAASNTIKQSAKK